MAQPAETFDSYDAIGNREDLSNTIWNISPMETPFQMMAGRGTASNRLHDWQTDALADPDQGNAVIEGDDATHDAVAPTTRLRNYTQISDKAIVVSGTEDSMNPAGRKKELSYQIAKKGQELKRDMEVILLSNQAAVAGNSTTARLAGSVRAWMETNTDLGATGANGGATGNPGVPVVATDGTQRALTETLLKKVIKDVWDAGGNPTVVMTGGFNKQVISGFSGHSTRYDKGEDKKLVAAVDVYVSDFGDHRIVPNRFSSFRAGPLYGREVFVLTPRLWSVDYLRGFQQHPLAKTGDSNKRQMLAEYTLASRNEAGSGIIADLTIA